VTQQEFQNSMNQLRQQSQANPSQLDPSMFDKPEFRQQVLDRLINQKLLLVANKDLGITVSGSQIAQEIAAIPAFQLNGKFDADTYKAVLAQQGMTPLGFQQKVQEDLGVQALPQAIGDTALAPAYEVDDYLRLRDQTRDVRYLELPRPAPGATAISDADVAAYYKAHTADFMNPETVSVDYIELKADDIKTDVVPDDAAIQARYEQQKSRFVSPEQRLVSHILVSVPANATPAQQKTALAKVEGIEKQLAAGADFGKLAEQDSDDLGSKRQGGDLGWIEPGMTDKAFDDAVFKMAKGGRSEPVLSPEGYHIIWLRDVRPGSAKPLAEVKDELVKELLSSQRERQFNEQAGKLTDLLYSNPTSLQSAVDKLGMKIEHSDKFTRKGGTGIAANQDVVKAAFSDQVLVQGQNSDPINIGSNDMVVLHLAQHQAATPKSLGEVGALIRQRIVDERVAAAAAKNAEALLARLRKGETLEQIAGEQKLELKSAQALKRMDVKLPPALTAAVFKMPLPEAKKPSSTLVDLGAGSYALVALDAVHDGDATKAPKAERDAIAAQLQQLRGDAAQRGLLDALRRHTKVEINKNNLNSEQEQG
jgi:peptidyl-prolyl cis-trans isomerase D